MALDPVIALENFSDDVRETNEMPSRISVVDVIAKTKGVTKNYAAQLFRRLQEVVKRAIMRRSCMRDSGNHSKSIRKRRREAPFANDLKMIRKPRRRSQTIRK